MNRVKESTKIYAETKRRVTKAKNEVHEKLYQKLNTKEGEKKYTDMQKQRDRPSKVIQHTRINKDKDGMCLSKEEDT